MPRGRQSLGGDWGVRGGGLGHCLGPLVWSSPMLSVSSSPDASWALRREMPSWFLKLTLMANVARRLELEELHAEVSLQSSGKPSIQRLRHA